MTVFLARNCTWPLIADDHKGRLRHHGEIRR